MAKQVKIRIFPDGRIRADIDGFSGPRCMDYVRILEEIIEARTVRTDLKPEYYQEQEESISAEQLKLSEIRLKKGEQKPGE